VNSFYTRTISGFVYAALVIGSIFLGPYYFAPLILVFLGLCLFEFSRIVQMSKKPGSTIIYFVSNTLIFVVSVFVILSFLDKYFILITLIYVLVSAIVYFLSCAKESRKIQTRNYLLSILYITLPLSLINLLFYLPNGIQTYEVLGGLFLIIWINDSFAYITGSLFGKHKLAKSLSPGKTWEGAIGGALFGLIGAGILSVWFKTMDLNQWLVFSMLIVIFGTFGDLFESLLKRKADIKESGNVMPGHGGILDRLDSLLFAIPVIVIYLLFI